MKMQMAHLLSAVLLSLGGAAAGAATSPILSGDTNRPEMSVYAIGEPVRLSFKASGLPQDQKDVKLLLSICDEHDKAWETKEVPVTPDATGDWRTEFEAPSKILGFYRVYAKLSTGLQLQKLGSRPAGYISYAVVPDPATRPLYSQKESFFGLSGGFSSKVNIMPYLGVRQAAGWPTWGAVEPNHPGEFAEQRAAAKAKGQDFPKRHEVETFTYKIQGKETPWTIYTFASMFSAPKKWKDAQPIFPETLGCTTGKLTPEGEKAWSAYCKENAIAYAEMHPVQEEHLYQITWEPVYPWGFKGTDEDLIHIYEIAYKAIHENDPKAFIIGPCEASIGNLGYYERMVEKGLDKYLDGFSNHPYVNLPPEYYGVRENTVKFKEFMMRRFGKLLPMFGTEQGYSTEEKTEREIIQARGLTRANLVMLGEGWRFNFAFYAVDYRAGPESGYGFYYNLNPKMNWGTDKWAPKPVAPAYAAMTYLLEGHKSAGAIEWLGETALGYAYERGDDIVLALWDFGDAPREVSIPVGTGAVELFDWMGNKLDASAGNGSLKLTLTQNPLYVKGVSPKIWSASAVKPLALKESRVIAYPQGKIHVAATISAGDAPIDATLLAQPDPRLGAQKTEKSVSVKAGGTSPVDFEISVPADAKEGTYPVTLALVKDGVPFAAVGCVARVETPIRIEHVDPMLSVDGGVGVNVVLTELEGVDAKGSIGLRILGVPESRLSAEFALAAKKGGTVQVKAGKLDVSPSKIYDAVISLKTEKGYSFEKTFPINFTPARKLAASLKIDGSPAKWKEVPVIPLKGPGDMARNPQLFKGGADLSSTFRYAWDANALYVACEVRDDVHLQENTGWATWKQDCLQLAFDLDPRKKEELTGNELVDQERRHRRCEIDFALTKNGPEVYRTATTYPKLMAEGLVDAKDLQLSVTRNGDVTFYEAAIPWKALGAEAAPAGGALIGVAATVNDADSPTEPDPKALGLFSLKDPRKFGMLFLGE